MKRWTVHIYKKLSFNIFSKLRNKFGTNLLADYHYGYAMSVSCWKKRILSVTLNIHICAILVYASIMPTLWYNKNNKVNTMDLKVEPLSLYIFEKRPKYLHEY